MAGVYGRAFFRGPTRDDIVVVNRSLKRAAPMVDDLKKLGPIRFAPWRVSYEVLPETDLLVKATSLGLYPNVDWMPDADLSRARCLVADAASQAWGLRRLDGLTMLVFQGVLGFKMWTGAKGDEAVLKETLLAAMVKLKSHGFST